MYTVLFGTVGEGDADIDRRKVCVNDKNVEISPDLVTKITEKIMLEVTAWKNRPLEAVYLFVFMDAIHYKVREGHRYVTKAAYVVLGIATDGRKDVKQVAADLKKIYTSVSVRQRMG